MSYHVLYITIFESWALFLQQGLLLSERFRYYNYLILTANASTHNIFNKNFSSASGLTASSILFVPHNPWSPVMNPLPHHTNFYVAALGYVDVFSSLRSSLIGPSQQRQYTFAFVFAVAVFAWFFSSTNHVQWSCSSVSHLFVLHK